MKINIECITLEHDNNLSIAENGLILLLKKYNNCGVIDFKTFKNNNLTEVIIDNLKKLVANNIIEIKNINQDNNVILHVSSKHQNSDSVNINKKEMIKKCFQLDELQINSIIEQSNNQKLLETNLTRICFDNYQEKKMPITVINSELDLINLLNVITPLETILTHNFSLDKNDFSNVYQLINDFDLPMPIINYAIDYAISKSKYGNLSYSFVRKLLKNWQKNNINSVKNAIDFINESNWEYSKNTSKFITPEYEKPGLIPNATINLNNMFKGDDKFE